jgi:transposase
MNASYASLIKECFPHAKLVVDRFHIVKHLIRSFNYAILSIYHKQACPVV